MRQYTCLSCTITLVDSYCDVFLPMCMLHLRSYRYLLYFPTMFESSTFTVYLLLRRFQSYSTLSFQSSFITFFLYLFSRLLFISIFKIRINFNRNLLHIRSLISREKMLMLLHSLGFSICFSVDFKNYVKTIVNLKMFMNLVNGHDFNKSSWFLMKKNHKFDKKLISYKKTVKLKKNHGFQKSLRI